MLRTGPPITGASEAVEALVANLRQVPDPVILAGFDTTVNGDTVTIGPGVMLLPGRWIASTREQHVTLAPADRYLSRIDVVALVAADDENDCSGVTGPLVKVIQGPPAWRPRRPKTPARAIRLVNVAVDAIEPCETFAESVRRSSEMPPTILTAAPSLTEAQLRDLRNRLPRTPERMLVLGPGAEFHTLQPRNTRRNP